MLVGRNHPIKALKAIYLILSVSVICLTVRPDSALSGNTYEGCLEADRQCINACSVQYDKNVESLKSKSQSEKLSSYQIRITGREQLKCMEDCKEDKFRCFKGIRFKSDYSPRVDYGALELNYENVSSFDDSNEGAQPQSKIYMWTDQSGHTHYTK